MKTIYYCLLFLLISSPVFAQNANINNFLVKESLLKNSKLAIIAADSLGEPMESINGLYTFTVSGFTQHIKFNDGVAILPMQLDKSSFVYVKHENDKGKHSKLLYVYKKDGTLNPITINSLWLVLFPFSPYFYSIRIQKVNYCYRHYSAGIYLL